MGLSIHYSGRLKHIALLPQLVEEVKDVCNILGWRYYEDNDEVAKGISFTPPESETLNFTFRPTGELVNKMYLHYNIEPSNTISVKTQFAGIEVHVAIIRLLKHLSAQYFSQFDLKDEGEYWETGDEEVLQKNVGAYNNMLCFVQTAMVDFKAHDGDTPQRLADRLEKFLNERWKED